MHAEAPSILIVEDERVIARDLALTLERLGYRVAGSVKDGEQAVHDARAQHPDLVLMDINLPGAIDGITAAERIRVELDIPVVYLTAFSDPATLARARVTQPHGYLVKPFREADLRSTLEMALYRHALERRQRAHERLLATTLRSIGDAVITTDAAAHVTNLNPAAEALTGWTRDDAAGHAVSEILTLLDGQSRAALPCPADAALRSHETQRLPEGTLLRNRGGGCVPVDDTAAPIIDDGGRVLGSVVVLRDAAERRAAAERIARLNAELEQRVRERTALLEAANEELEAFSYSVAHDLRAPLRGIDGFSRAVLEEHGAQLDALARADLLRVRAAAARMGQLIDDLLGLARIARRDLVRRSVDLSAIAREVAAALQQGEPERRVAWVLADGIRADGDANLLRIVLENLLGNAWKFTAETAAPRIEFFARPADGGVEYVVRDNGVGFDPDYGHKLFGAFQRLHLAEEFAGNGIGLATVQRIVHRHGGRVAASGAVGAGASFSFTL